MQIDVARLEEALGGNPCMFIRTAAGKMSRMDIKSYLDGESEPTARVLREICRQTRVSADWLCGRSDSKWLDPSNMGVCVPNLYGRICELDPYGTDTQRSWAIFTENKSPESAMSRIKKRASEGGSYATRLSTLVAVCDGYGASIDWLIGIGARK